MIYAGIDIGSDLIKIVVGQVINDKVNVLASTNTRTVGIKKGVIVDKDMVSKSLSLALLEIEKQIGFKLDKACITIPSYDLDIKVYDAISYTDGIVTGDDIINCFKGAIKDNITKDREVITVFPIDFLLDDEEKCLDPKGMNAYKLESRVLISTLPKEFVYTYLEVCQKCNVEVIDLAPATVCDYYQSYRPDFKEKTGAIINLGESKTEIGLFNKGLLVKSEIIPIGGKKIDQDIKYIYHIDKVTTRELKENFAVSCSAYANADEKIEIENSNDEKKEISQMEISQIIEARMIDILKSVKNSLINLTNKEISYIIITGGISNLPGFNYLVESIFGDITYVMNMNIFGVRSNIYSTSYGLIKYYKEKLELRGISYTMYESIIKNPKKKSILNGYVISKINECND